VNNVWQGDPDSDISIQEQSSGFLLTRSNGKIENYDNNGKLVSEIDTHGKQTSYTYDNSDQLIQVVDHYGHQLSLSYDQGRLKTVTAPDGSVFSYNYDLLNNLESVVYPDDTASDDDNPVKTYHYDNQDFPNHLTGITDENDDRLSFYEYDNTGRAISTKWAQTTNLNHQKQFTIDYSQGPDRSIVTDAEGTQEEWQFERRLGVNKLISKTNLIDNISITQTWDTNGNKLTRTDAEGQTTKYTYNTHNQKISKVEAFGTSEARTTSYEYVSDDIDLVNRTIEPSIYSSNTKTTIHNYGPNLILNSMTLSGFTQQGSPVTRSHSFGYDSLGKITLIDGPRTDLNDYTHIRYYDCDTGNGCGQLREVENALGHITTYDEYDASGRLLQTTAANGLITRYTYTPRGWLLTVEEIPQTGQPRITSNVYDNTGQLDYITLADGSSLDYEYDASHALRSIQDTLGNRIEYKYDARGNLIDESTIDPDGTLVRVVVRTYDIRNFVKSINSSGSTSELIKNAVGDIVSETDPNLNPPTLSQYDDLHRVDSVIDALGNTTDIDHNVADEVSKVTAPNGATTLYEYDDLGNMTKEISADRGTTDYTHDTAGNLISRTDARGVVTNYSYDALNRLTLIDYPGSDEDVSYIYDSATLIGDNCGLGIGLLCTVSDQSGGKLYVYDAFTNIVRWHHIAEQKQFTWEAEYDNSNRLISQTYPEGRTLTIHRDAVGRLTGLDSTLNGASIPIISNRTYRADGLRTAHLLGNAIQDTRSYDLQGRLTDFTSSTILQKTLNYDLNGNITQIDESSDSQLYQYDALDRLTESLAPTDAIGFSYDTNSNRLEKSVNGVAQTSLYATLSNRQVSLGSDSVQLDAAGNTISDQAGTRVYTYNQAGRIASISKQGALVSQYKYDHDGLRATKTAGSQSTIYQYGLDGKLLAETGPNGHLSKEYVYADGDLVAVIEREPGTPIVTAPADILIEASAVLTPVNLGVATAVDINNTALPVVADSSGPYPVGTTNIAWSASTGSVQGFAVQTVTVVDTTPPLITAPEEATVYDVNNLSNQIGQASATDIFELTISNNLPNTFSDLSYGSQLLVVWQAQDSNGNQSIAVQTVTLLDTSLNCAAIEIAAQGTASQSSTHRSDVASKATNGIFTDSASTSTVDTNASWQLDYNEGQVFDNVVIHNRSIYMHWLRDLLVSVEDANGIQVYESELLNPENVLNGPAIIQLELPPQIVGHKLKIRRVHDNDLSGGGISAFEGFLLSMAEVEIQGCIAPQGGQ
jgi:YD repeat-containing protein